MCYLQKTFLALAFLKKLFWQGDVMHVIIYFLFILQLNQQCEDRTVLRYVYYYLARILSDNGAQGLSSGGGIPTPNWDALADIDAGGGVTRADVVPRIVEQLSVEASNAEIECKRFLVLIFDF